MQIGAVALEELVRRQRQENIEIAGRPAAHAGLAFAGEPDAGAVLDAGGMLTDSVRSRVTRPEPAQDRAGILDHLAAALTARAGPLQREEALRLPHPALRRRRSSRSSAWCRPWRRCPSRPRR